MERCNRSEVPTSPGWDPALPPSARHVLESLAQEGTELREIAQRLLPLLEGPTVVTRRRRLGLIVGCALFPFLETALTTQTFVGDPDLFRHGPELVELGQHLGRLQTLARVVPSAGLLRQREALELYVAGRFRDVVTNEDLWSGYLVRAVLPLEQRRLAERLVGDRVSATNEVAAAALEPPDLLRNPAPAPGRARALTLFVGRILPRELLGSGVFEMAIVGLLAALLFRGGAMIHALGLTFVDRHGRRASRPRIVLRNLLVWLPALPMHFSLEWPGGVAFGWAVLALYSAGLGYAMRHPDRGIPDRLAGTRMVPK